MKKLFLLLLTVFAVSLCASAQMRTISGTVVDDANDEPIIGASVTVGTGSNNGVVTDINGDFSIRVPESVKKLTVSYVGYTTQQVAITGGKIKVRLVPSNEILNDVIVVAYGTTTKAAYTGSAAVVKADQLEDALVANVTNALTGKMAGVQTFSSNGQPGTSSSVLIRGVGSINAGTAPLYVVDGMPYDGDIAAIATSDIESITVLKDAASTALYGARGANGVILVTTKKGKEGNAKVTVDMRWGSNSRAVPQYDVITDQRQFLETTYQALNMTAQNFNGLTAADAHIYANNSIWNALGYQTWTVPEGQYAFNSKGKFNPNATPGYSNGRYFFIGDDWTKETLINGLRQEYNVSITGGTERLNYYVSGSYLNDEGIIKNSHFNRLSTTAAVDYQAKPWLKIGTNLRYSYTNSAYPDGMTNSDATASGNAFYFINYLGPVYPMYVRNPDGSIMMNKEFNRPIFDYGDGADYGNGLIGATRTPTGNPAGQLLYDVTDYLADVFDGKWYAVINPIEGLNITGTLSYHVDNTRAHQVLNSLYGQFAAMGGEAIQEADRYRSLQGQVLASYGRTFAGVHNVDVLLGYETQDYQSEFVYGLGENLYNPNNFTVNNTIDQKNAGGAQSNLAHRGWLGRLNYNYANKYFFMASFRRDGSSRFAPEHRWGTFWSASAGWDINKENFMQQFSNNVDLLKFKVSFGQNGNDGIGYNYIAYADQYRMTGADGVFADATLVYKGNRDITWETSNAFNVGFDFSFWKGKLSGTAEYYSRQTSDMLFNVPVAPSLGFSSIPKNVGSMRNSGFEIDLNYRPINTKDITWEINANITLPSNKIIKLEPSLLDEDGYWWLSTVQFRKEGESMYQLAIPKYAGVDPENGDALYWALRDLVDPETGEVVYSDKIIGYEDNGDPIYDTVKEEYKTVEYVDARNTNKWETGSLMPKAYGGFGTTLNVYGFDLSASFSYQLGGRIIDYGYQNLTQPGTYIGNAWHKDMLNAWTPENKNTDIPRLYTAANKQYANSLSDRYLISSNYLALNNVTIGYTFPKEWTKKASIASVRLYAAAENVALWSKRKGLDPRQGFITSDNHTYSPIRAISGGIRVEF